MAGLEQTNQSEDSIKQNTTCTSHLLITVLLLEGEPWSTYKVHKQQSYTLQPILYLYTGTIMRDLAVDSQRYLPVNRSSAQLSLIGYHLHHFVKPLTYTEDDHAPHSDGLVGDFCLSPAPPPHCTHGLRPQTITPEGSAKHLWNAPQDTWYGNQIWKSGHRGHPWHPGLNPLGFHATGPPCIGGRQWFIWWILWGNLHSPPLDWLTRAIPIA